MTTTVVKKEEGKAFAPVKSLTYGRPRGFSDELKWADTAIATYAADTTGTITLLNAIAIGDDYNARTSRKTYVTSVHLEGCFLPYDTTTTATLGRVLLVWDKAPNSVAPSITDIITTVDSCSQYSMLYRGRFRVLYDRQLTLGSADLVTAGEKVASGKNIIPLRVTKKIKAKTVYNGSAATIGSISQGALWLVTLGDQVLTNSGVLRCSTRVRFTDA